MFKCRFIAWVLVMGLSLMGWAQEEADEGDLSLQIVHPISNPVYHGSAYPQTTINAIYLYQQLPDQVSLQGGAKVKLGGDVQVYALQLEYAFSTNLSFVANKDGYVIMNPDNSLSDEEGFANLAFGLKWAPYVTETAAVALRGTLEVPTGNDRVLQGSGDGSFSPALLGTYNSDYLSMNGAGGVIIPFDNESESTISYVSLGAYAHATTWLHPLAEINWFRVLHAGDGETSYDNKQGGKLISNNVSFEGGDFFNFGAAGSAENRDLVTAAIGLWLDLCKNASIGFAYEIPLTDEEDSLMKERYNVNLRVTF